MKMSMTLTPLVMAMAAAMAISAQAGQRNHHYDPLLDRDAGDATANVDRDQYIGHGTNVTNQGTQNSVELTDTLNENSGHVGANIAAGSLNQQANDVAIATADENFVFGSARAEVRLEQENTGTHVMNSGSAAVTTDGFGNNASGAIGINVASGDVNQQANALSIATASGWSATASVQGTQDLSDMTVKNEAAGVTYVVAKTFNQDFRNAYSSSASSDASESWQESAEAQSSASASAAGAMTAHYDSSWSANRSASASADASMDQEQSSSASANWNKSLNVDASGNFSVSKEHEHTHNSFSASGEGELVLNVNADKSWSADQQSAASASMSASANQSASYSADKTLDVNKSFEASYSESQEASASASAQGSRSASANSSFEEVGSTALAASATFTKARIFLDPVTNTVSMNNSLNGASGSLGVNVAAGVGNQQMNTMSIAAGCNACASNGNGNGNGDL